MMQQWINGVLGLALIALAFMGLTGTTLLWALVIMGAAVAILGFWGAISHNAMMTGNGRQAYS